MWAWYLRHQRSPLYLWLVLVLALMLGAEWQLLSRGLDAAALAVILMFAVWAFAGYAAFNRISIGRSSRAVARLNDLCDPEPLLAWADEELAYWTGKRCRYSYIAVCLMNRAVALDALGRTEESMDVIQRVQVNRLNDQMALVYFMDMAVIGLNLGRLEEAGQRLWEAERLYAGLKQKKADQGTYSEAVECARFGLRMAMGESGGMEERMAELLSAASCEYRRVTLHMLLARLCLMEQRWGDAREHLRYAVTHGNKLACRAKAERLLSEMEGNGRG